MDTAHTDAAAGPAWRLRVELNDRPGTLARLTAGLAARDCNILALTVLPVTDGVVDDLIISTPEGLLPADLITLVRAVGGRCAGITQADLHDLTDTPTSALRAATSLIERSASYAEAVRDLLGADAAEPLDSADSTGDSSADTPGDSAGDATPEISSAAGERQAVIGTTEGTTLLLRRGWAAFTEVELARANALADFMRALDLPSSDPTAVVTEDGAGIVLRPGRPSDTDAVAAMHDRCSRASLFARYHTGTRSVPRRLLNRLLAPPRGQTIVGVQGHQVVAVGQLINTSSPNIGEVSLLVEDDWHGQGIGTALLGYLVRMARAAGYAELLGWCLPGERGLIRTATRAGVPMSTSYEDKLMRVALDIRDPADLQVASTEQSD